MSLNVNIRKYVKLITCRIRYLFSNSVTCYDNNYYGMVLSDGIMGCADLIGSACETSYNLQCSGGGGGGV